MMMGSQGQSLTFIDSFIPVAKTMWCQRSVCNVIITFGFGRYQWELLARIDRNLITKTIEWSIHQATVPPGGVRYWTALGVNNGRQCFSPPYFPSFPPFLLMIEKNASERWIGTKIMETVTRTPSEWIAIVNDGRVRMSDERYTWRV